MTKLITEICKRKYVLALLCEIILYSMIFSFVTVKRMYSLQTFSYDLGNYNQAFYTTLFEGRLFYYTADLPANPSGSLFGVHFTPLFFILLPIYFLYPRPETLLIVQSIVIGLGALPIYYMTTRKLKNELLGLLLAGLYLLNPAVQGINWYDFHPEAFIPFFMLSALHFFDTQKTAMYFAFILLALSCTQFVSICIIFMVIYLLLRCYFEKKRAIEEFYCKEVKILLLTILLAIIWLALSLHITHLFNPYIQVMSGKIYWEELDAETLLEVPIKAVLNPMNALRAISYDFYEKIIYALILFGTVMFLPLLEPCILICFIPWLSIAFLSNYPPFYQLGLQYPAFVVPFLFYGTVLGLRKLTNLMEKRRSQKILRYFYVFFIIFCLFFTVTLSPLNSSPPFSYSYISYGIPQVNEHNKYVLKLVNLVPKDASVLTQSNIFPLLSSRHDAYVFPSSCLYILNHTFNETLQNLINKVDYILLDIKSDPIATILTLRYINCSNFGMYASVDGAILLKRYYNNTPVYFKPLEEVFDYSNLHLVNGNITKDKTATNGKAIVHLRKHGTGDVWYGPYVLLPPGRYEVTFRLKISNNSSSNDLITLDVTYFNYAIRITYVGTESMGYHLKFKSEPTGIKKTLVSRRISAHDFSRLDVYETFSLEFTVNSFGYFEFRGMNATNLGDIYLDEITLYQLEPSINIDFEISYTYEN